MIRARIKYPNGQTALRQGTALIDAALAGGCVIIPDQQNQWPKGLYDSKVEHATTEEVKHTAEPEVKLSRKERRSRNKFKAVIAAMLIATGANAQQDIPPLPADSAHLCLTYMRGYGQYTHPTIGPFEVGIFKDSRGNFWTVRLAPGIKPKEGDEFTINQPKPIDLP